MSTSPAELNATGLLQQFLQQARSQAREQLAAAWQLHVARVEEQLRSGWMEHLDRLLEERFHELAASLTCEVEAAIESQVREGIASALERERGASTRALTQLLNQTARRLRQAEKQEEWSGALLDAATPFAARAAIFTIQGDSLRLEKASFEAAPCELPLRDAPAIAAAAASMDPLAVAFSAAELSEPVAAALGAPASDRVYLFPLTSRSRTVALLYAETARDRLDVNALELAATVAAAVWEARSASQSAALAAIQPAPAARPVTLPAWAELPPAEQELHLRAQRFARVQVAEIRLYQSPLVKQGRAEQSLYRLLKDHIDRGRDAYRDQFLKDCPSMVDYFHVELVRTLANDDASLLGPDYPGPLV